MLSFEICFLSGRYYGCSFRDRRRVEWPPHPARFFSALVAAFKENDLGPTERRALEWLEQQGDPRIAASERWERVGVTSFVPPNDCDWTYNKNLELYVPTVSFIPALRERKSRFFPSAAPLNPVVYFSFPDAEPAQHAAALSAVAERVTYLGSSASLVQVRLSESAPEPTWVPDEDGECSLRVVRPRRLADLETAYENGNRLNEYSWARYRRVREEAPDKTLAETILSELFVFRLKSQSGQSLSIHRAVTVTDAVQGRLIEVAGDSRPSVLAHEGQHPHCAFVALPYVGNQHADGHILGFAVILHKEISPNDRREILRVLGKLTNDPQLVIQGRGVWDVEYIAGAASRRTLARSTWARPAREWRSVTPVLFDEFPDDRYAGRTFGDLVRRYCDEIGLPSPREVTISPYPSVTGAAPVFEYKKQPQRREQWRYSAHATLIFDKKVRGPVLLGAGRYFGMGLMRPMADRREG